MATVWSIFVTFWWYLPWVAIALMGALALRRRHSMPLLMQAGGAAGMFLLGFLQWVVNWLLGLTSATYEVRHAAGIIFEFLMFVALVVFALGYCLERMRRGAVEVAATVVR